VATGREANRTDEVYITDLQTAQAGTKNPTGEKSLPWLKFNPNHSPVDGRFTSGGGLGSGIGAGPEETPTESVKSIRAKQNHKVINRVIQRYSEERNEPILARGVGGVALRDNEPVDVMLVKGGIVQHGIELKTMVSNGNRKITMKKSAMERKEKWVAQNRAHLHTVVFDDHKVYNAGGPGQHGPDSDRVIYYRRGYGSFRVPTMHKVEGGMDELKTLMETPNNALPLRARPPKTYPKRDEEKALVALSTN
jgi:hypothetical protein